MTILINLFQFANSLLFKNNTFKFIVFSKGFTFTVLDLNQMQTNAAHIHTYIHIITYNIYKRRLSL